MDLFKKTNISKLTATTAVVALLALGATDASADGTNGGLVTGTVTATFDNTVTVTETTPINFGSMVAILDNDVGNTANLDVVMSTAGVIAQWPGVAGAAPGVAPWVPTAGVANIGTGVPKARVFPTGGGAARTAGVYTITGVALGASMGIIYNNTAVNNKLPFAGGNQVNLVCAACVVGTEPDIEFGAIVDDTAAGIATDGDNDGTIVVKVGGTLRIPNTPSTMNLTGVATVVVGAIEDGTYTGNLIVSAIY